jgi:co-chaperonin GroES (HSP10)
MEISENKLKNLIIVGDRVLIKPKSLSDKTKTGLYLPPGVQEKEIVQSGYVIKAGPGYPLAQATEDMEESWKATDEKVKYIPLQVKEGDLAVFLQKGSVEVLYKEEKYFIVPQNQILMIEREEF